MAIGVGTAILGAGALSMLGSVGSSLFGASSAKRQMRFQERMSNTAHQREMADLRKAGLNPLLTGKYGGSSTPPGTAFTPQNPAEKVPEAASAYAGLKQAKPLIAAQINSQNAATAKLMAETEGISQSNARLENLFPLEMDKLIQDTETAQTTGAKGVQDIAQSKQAIIKMKEEVLKIEQDWKKILQETKKRKFYGTLYQEGSDILNFLKNPKDASAQYYKRKKDRFKEIRNQLRQDNR